LKKHILTEENLPDLVRLTNKDLARTTEAENGKLVALKGQIDEVDRRLAKLYDAGPS
jgi:hypothetical protein